MPFALPKLSKVPLLAVESVCTQIYLTPPDTKGPDAAEEARYKEYNVRDVVPSNVVAPQVFKLIAHVMDILEAVAIICSASPYLSTSRFALTPKNGDKVYISKIFLVGILFSVVGTSLRVACFRNLGRQFTFQLTLRKSHKLVTSGPYSVVRHPGYTALFMCFTGTILCHLGPGSLWTESGMWVHPGWKWFGCFYAGYRLYVSFAIFRRIQREDMVLRKEFGGQWEAWAKKTPYKLIPFVY